MQVESPAKRVERFAESARTEFVRIEQLPALWAAIEAADRDVGDFLKMLLFTGQRPDQVCGMRWADVDLDTGAWIVAGSGTKTARRYEIPLAPQAVELLRARRDVVGTWPWVFTGRRGKRRRNFGQQWQKVCEQASFPGLQLRDLRRTTALQDGRSPASKA